MVKLLSTTSDIWELTPTPEELRIGAEYAAITLPWTFNRMMLNTGASGQRERGLNISKGIVAQEMLRRAFKGKGIIAETQRKSYRDDDLFDFLVHTTTGTLRIDIKSVAFYKDYSSLGRQALSSELILKYSDYAGSDWRTFFPMLVPHTQIHQTKEAYCFAVASTIDPRRDVYNGREEFVITAYPYGVHLGFLSSRTLVIAREMESNGISLSINYTGSGRLLEEEFLDLTILGEWDGKKTERVIRIYKDKKPEILGQFSCVSAFQLPPEQFRNFFGSIDIEVVQNRLKTAIHNSLRRDINVAPKVPLSLNRDGFCNLILPRDYKLFVLGWIDKAEFLEKCWQYQGWVWPSDKISRYHNQSWSQITENDESTLSRAGFSEAIQRNPGIVNAGWLKTTGNGGGACCYYFPNVGRNGGVKETNLYVLPKDLTVIEGIGKL